MNFSDKLEEFLRRRPKRIILSPRVQLICATVKQSDCRSTGYSLPEVKQWTQKYEQRFSSFKVLNQSSFKLENYLWMMRKTK